MAEERRGWHPDPFAAHELRYFALDGKPTRLVRDADRWSHDVPPGTTARACAILREPPHQVAPTAPVCARPPWPAGGRRIPRARPAPLSNAYSQSGLGHHRLGGNEGVDLFCRIAQLGQDLPGVLPLVRAGTTDRR